MDPDGWLAEQRADEAAQARSRQRWLRQQAVEGASFAGVLVDMAEDGRPVVVHTSAGTTHHGTLLGVGPDHVVVRSSVGADALIPIRAISSVRALGGAAVDGDRPSPLDVTFAEALLRLVGDRPRVQVATTSGVVESGVLVGVGTDVITVTVGDRAGPAGTAVIPMAGVADLTILG